MTRSQSVIIIPYFSALFSRLMAPGTYFHSAPSDFPESVSLLAYLLTSPNTWNFFLLLSSIGKPLNIKPSCPLHMQLYINNFGDWVKSNPTADQPHLKSWLNISGGVSTSSNSSHISLIEMAPGNKFHPSFFPKLPPSSLNMEESRRKWGVNIRQSITTHTCLPRHIPEGIPRTPYPPH